MAITCRQLLWMLTSMQVVMTVLLTTSGTVAASHQDAWVSVLLAILLGLAVVYINVRLSMCHPGQTFIQFVRRLLGKWIGGLVIVVYLLYWFCIYIAIIRQFSTFIIATILPETPISMVMLLMAAGVLYLTLSGLSVIGRISELVGPVFPILL
ncbi:GerAB/ArcD/ProY family transporter [Paenibacillus gansuensis]|uniref:GerAB/ArcD/ProY family transporter n=1 Tax=Paenibacillus gansuensis TaxID=306542 RepID=A0ABW5PJV9_9BACL